MKHTIDNTMSTVALADLGPATVFARRRAS